jgi:cytochrome c-type biogenesis protein CcmH
MQQLKSSGRARIQPAYSVILRGFLVILVAVAALAQTASEKPSVDVRRVGARLKCQCGCPDSVATCSMLECHFSKPAKEKIAKMQAAGMNDQTIVQSFISEYGAGIYLAPPNALGWIVPYASVGVGILIIVAFVRKYRKPKPLPVIEADLAKYQAQIEKDMANLE